MDIDPTIEAACGTGDRAYARAPGSPTGLLARYTADLPSHDLLPS